MTGFASLSLFTASSFGHSSHLQLGLLLGERENVSDSKAFLFSWSSLRAVKLMVMRMRITLVSSYVLNDYDDDNLVDTDDKMMINCPMKITLVSSAQMSVSLQGTSGSSETIVVYLKYVIVIVWVRATMMMMMMMVRMMAMMIKYDGLKRQKRYNPLIRKSSKSAGRSRTPPFVLPSLCSSLEHHGCQCHHFHQQEAFETLQRR